MGTNNTVIEPSSLELAQEIRRQGSIGDMPLTTNERLVDAIVYHCQERARSIPKFRDEKNGAVRVLLNPLTHLAAGWLGYDPFRYDSRDHREREEVAKIGSWGSHTAVFPTENGGTCLVNCYAYTSLKIAALSLYRKKHEDADYMKWLCDMRMLIEENGYAVCKGAKCISVKLCGKDFMRIFVAVSGASGEEDHECATAGANEAKAFFDEITAHLSDKGWNFEAEVESDPDWEGLGFKLVP